jgi:sugar/nucleoside kinase (ribokinase family)
VRTLRPWIGAAAAAGMALASCGGERGREAALEAALERSRAVAAADWIYGSDTLPPEPGETRPRIVDRCRIVLPGEEPLDVACGEVFLGLEQDADTAWIARVVEGLGGEVVDRGRVPAWTSVLGEPQTYLLVRVGPRTEGRTLVRALSSEGVRFVDVRQVRRRGP